MPNILLPGDSAPWFVAPVLDGHPQFAFDQSAGRAVVMLFPGSAVSDDAAEALRLVAEHRAIFDDRRAAFFGVTRDPADAASGRIAKQLPGIRWILDYDGAISRSFGAIDDNQCAQPHWLLLDPMLRVVGTAPLGQGQKIFAGLRRLLSEPRGDEIAPVLIVPRIFEPELCRQLIALYEQNGGRPTGFMRDVEGVTTGIHNTRFKRRLDYTIEDRPLRARIRARLNRFLAPQIARAFQFQVTRVERYIVACYDGDGDGGFFKAHRDNTSNGTAHRRFACTINLNAEDYEGGELLFPEFGSRRYRAPTGGAVVFSCSLLHEATPVTRGKRYAYLPFLYDEAAARQREANAHTGKVSERLAGYRA